MITSCHPNVKDHDYELLISKAKEDIESNGYVSDKVLRILFDVFTWLYIEGLVEEAFITESALKQFLMSFDLTIFMGDGPIYSTILLYNKMARSLNLRSLEIGNVISKKEGANKELTGSDFKYKDLYNIYKKSACDISSDFLIFNELFNPTVSKEKIKMTSYGEITKLVSSADYVRPDFKYKMSKKTFDIKENRIENDQDESNKLYVLQDSSYSMKGQLDALNMIKVFILEQAFKNNYNVNWLNITNQIKDEVLFSKESIELIDRPDTFYSGTMNVSEILCLNRFKDKKVIIITDGTDDFDISFNTKTRDISVVSFKENINLKNKIRKYGRFFKIKV